MGEVNDNQNKILILPYLSTKKDYKLFVIFLSFVHFLRFCRFAFRCGIWYTTNISWNCSQCGSSQIKEAFYYESCQNIAGRLHHPCCCADRDAVVLAGQNCPPLYSDLRKRTVIFKHKIQTPQLRSSGFHPYAPGSGVFWVFYSFRHPAPLPAVHLQSNIPFTQQTLPDPKGSAAFVVMMVKKRMAY